MTPTAKQGARFGAYHRVSDANGRDIEDESTMTDKEAWAKIDGWAASSGVVIHDRYLDWDRTGSKLQRPELDRVIADLDAGVIDGVVVAKTDRFSRAKVSQALKLIGEIQERHPNSLALLDLGVDPTTPTGELMLTLLLAIAHMQWRQFKETWMEAQKRAVARGLWIGPAPLGYTASIVGHTKKGKPLYGPLVPDQNAPIMTKAFKIAATDGLHAAAAYLDQVVPDRRWRTSDARRLLSARAYLGEIVFGEGDGQLVNRKAHKPLTTLAIFEAAQTDPRARRSNGDYPLSHAVMCGACGKGMVGALQTVRERKYRRYRCSAACRGGASINADALETYVREAMEQALADRRFRDAFSPAGLDEAHAALTEAEDEVERYLADLDVRNRVGDERWRRGLDARLRAEEEVRERYQQIANQSAQAETLPQAEELDDPDQFARALRALLRFVSIIVDPGRGDDRVHLVPVDNRDRVARALAA